jgi:hypothetical protein
MPVGTIQVAIAFASTGVSLVPEQHAARELAVAARAAGLLVVRLGRGRCHAL